MKLRQYAAFTLGLTVAVLLLVGCAESPTGVTESDAAGPEGTYLQANQEMFGLAKGWGYSLIDFALVQPDAPTEMAVFGGKIQFPAGAVTEPTFFIYRVGVYRGNLVFVVTIPGHRGHFELEKPATLMVDKRFVQGEPEFTENIETGDRYFGIENGGNYWINVGPDIFSTYAWGILD